MIKRNSLKKRIEELEKKVAELSEKLEKTVPKNTKKERTYALDGVPEYQLNYINDILEADKTK